MDKCTVLTMCGTNQKIINYCHKMATWIHVLFYCTVKRTEGAFKVFDVLDLSLASYGSQVWLPHSAFFGSLDMRNFNTNGIRSNSASDCTERLVLRFFKWPLRLHKTFLNSTRYGDIGRFPAPPFSHFIAKLATTVLYRRKQQKQIL